MKVEKFYDHPDYEATSIVNDVALIELPQEVQYTGKNSKLRNVLDFPFSRENLLKDSVHVSWTYFYRMLLSYIDVFKILIWEISKVSKKL